MKEEGLSLYFLALIPPSPLLKEADALKQYFKTNYQSKASLNSPSHITLHMPFKWKEAKETKLIENLETFIQQNKPLLIDLKNFGSFEPRVIFIHTEKTPELESFQKELERFCKRTFQLFNAQYRDLPFHPHITLAFRDLKKPMFYKAWEEFKQKEFARHFLADRVALLKHNGKVWEVHCEFYFITD